MFLFVSRLSPEALFLRAAKSTTNHHLTDEVAIAYRLDICALYRVRYIT